MSNTSGKFGLKVAFCVIAGSLALSLGGGLAVAQDKSATTIVNQLQPKPLTRSLSMSPADTAKNAADESFINSVRHRTTRSLSSGEREKIATVVKDKPSIDLEINFEFNSARIGQEAAPQVNELGKALTDPSLDGNTFVLAGYADGKGRANYNQDLSERRADAVKRYLVEKYGIPAGKLVTVGYGSTHFKNPNDPYAAENRRVAVTNMADKQISSK
jgi:outer membrane protein OmpA-like peptidoglycan-associated protein